MRPKGTAQDLEARRLRAATLLRQGIHPAEVAKQVGVHRSSVVRWKQAWQQGGTAALAAKPSCGRPSRLSTKQKHRLVQLLLRGARKAGYPNELWTCPRVANLIQREFGVSYHPDWVWQILHDLGWSCQKPASRAREQDEAAIRHWRRYDWPRIKKGRPAQS
jgi:transposase